MLEKFYFATQQEWEADGFVSNVRDLLIGHLLLRYKDVPKDLLDRILACDDGELMKRAIFRDLDGDPFDPSFLNPTP